VILPAGSGRSRFGSLPPVSVGAAAVIVVLHDSGSGAACRAAKPSVRAGAAGAPAAVFPPRGTDPAGRCRGATPGAPAFRGPLVVPLRLGTGV